MGREVKKNARWRKLFGEDFYLYWEKDCQLGGSGREKENLLFPNVRQNGFRKGTGGWKKSA